MGQLESTVYRLLCRLSLPLNIEKEALRGGLGCEREISLTECDETNPSLSNQDVNKQVTIWIFETALGYDLKRLSVIKCHSWVIAICLKTLN